MFCPKCGKQLNDGDTFCAFCGETLNNGGNTNQVFQTPPVSYNAQQYQAPSSVPDNTVSAKRSNTALISAVSAVICLVLIGGFVLFVKPGYLLKRDDDNNSKTNTTTSAVTSESKPAVSTEESEEKPTETKPTEETPTETQASTAGETATSPVKDVLYGDANQDGDVNIMDVITVNKYLVGAGKLEGDAFIAADVDLSGEVNSTDSLNILKYAVDIIDKLPVESK